MTSRQTRVLEGRRKTQILRAEGVAGWLVPRSGKQAGQIFPLNDVNVIGRSSACHIFLDEDHVSSRHAEIAWRDETWVLTDMKSANATAVGGSPLSAGERYVGLADNDVLRFGDLEVTFKCA